MMCAMMLMIFLAMLIKSAQTWNGLATDTPSSRVCFDQISTIWVTVRLMFVMPGLMMMFFFFTMLVMFIMCVILDVLLVISPRSSHCLTGMASGPTP